MTETELRSALSSHLLPMLGASLLPQSQASAQRDQLVSFFQSTQQIAVKSKKSDLRRLIMRRSQEFTKDELKLVRYFMNELRSAYAPQVMQYRQTILRNLPTRVVSRTLGDSRGLRLVLQLLDAWSSQTYEGRRITASIGVISDNVDSELTLKEYSQESYARIMSNGFDTLLSIGRNGKVRRLETLDSEDASQKAPYQLRHIASWAQKGALGAVLNSHGEVLLFENSALRFAKRRGRWTHYAHDAIHGKLYPPQNASLRRALWESCLDASFSRLGACIGVVGRGRMEDVLQIVNSRDRLKTAGTPKSLLFAQFLGTSFSSIDRRLRHELLSMDGALILDPRGLIIAVGAIIGVEGGSPDGGRFLAAKTLSKYGLGVKVSADGPMVGFRDDCEAFRS